MAVCLLALAGTGANAALVVSTTRVIVEERSRQTTVQISNQGEHATLVQMWVDTGLGNTPQDNANLPFDLTPPVVRLDLGKGQSVRVLQTGHELPPDRESLFWFNALEVPPANKDGGKHFVQFTLHTRLKLLYRPDNLPLTPEEAHKRLQFHLENSAEGAEEKVVRVKNPSPYYMTLASVSVHSGDVQGNAPTLATLRNSQERMIAPWSDAVLRLDWQAPAPRTIRPRFAFSVVNDHGGQSRGERTDVDQATP